MVSLSSLSAAILCADGNSKRRTLAAIGCGNGNGCSTDRHRRDGEAILGDVGNGHDAALVVGHLEALIGSTFGSKRNGDDFGRATLGERKGRHPWNHP